MGVKERGTARRHVWIRLVLGLTGTLGPDAAPNRLASTFKKTHNTNRPNLALLHADRPGARRSQEVLRLVYKKKKTRHRKLPPLSQVKSRTDEWIIYHNCTNRLMDQTALL